MPRTGEYYTLHNGDSKITFLFKDGKPGCKIEFDNRRGGVLHGEIDFSAFGSVNRQTGLEKIKMLREIVDRLGKDFEAELEKRGEKNV